MDRSFQFRFFIFIFTPIFILFGCSQSYLIRTISNETVIISNEWKEIKPKQPLYCDRKNQEILLTVLTKHETDTTQWGIRLQDGSIAIPEIQIKSSTGKIYDLNNRSFLGESLVLTNYELPNLTKFEKLRIRCNKPIQISKMQWSCYNFEDVKR